MEPSSLLAPADASPKEGDLDQDAASTKPSIVSARFNAPAENDETDEDDDSDQDDTPAEEAVSSEDDDDAESDASYESPPTTTIMAGDAHVELRSIRPPSPYGDGFELTIRCRRNSRNDYLRWFFNQWKQVNQHLVQG